MSVYFDHNATTPLSVAARDTWLKTAEKFWHNPSSLYPEAGAAARRLEDERENLAQLLGVDDHEESGIIFTSGATEANNATLSYFADANPSAQCVISSVEHPSVDAPATRHFGNRAITVPVTPDGTISLPDLEKTLAAKTTCIVSVMAANNETGVIQPFAEVSSLCREHKVIFHCDAVQWFGKHEPGEILAAADIVVGSAHKFGAPKGTGFLRTAETARHVRMQIGGPQEGGRRAGTENLPGIAAMVSSLGDASDKFTLWEKQRQSRDDFEAEILSRLPGTSVVAQNSSRLPNTSMLIMPSGRNLKWLTRLGRLGFAISTGSACSSGSTDGSHVLRAMGLGPAEINRALRISSGLDTDHDQWNALSSALQEVSRDIAHTGPTNGKSIL